MEVTMEKINLITPEDMATFDRIDRDCLKMHVCPPPKTFINMKVHDASGNLTLDMDMPSRSWVRNAYNYMAMQFLGVSADSGGTTFGEGKLPLKDTSGAIKQTSNIYYTSSTINYAPTATTGVTGIQVGSSATAESFEHNELAAMITSGSAAGELNYQAMSPGVATYDSGTKKWTVVHSRIFNNNSGGDVTVNETAWVWSISSSYIMVSRDLLPSAVTVSNAAQLTVTYTIEMTFPA